LEAQVTTTSSPARTGNRLPKPRQAQAKLLAAAQEVFVAQGYHAAAMDEMPSGPG